MPTMLCRFFWRALAIKKIVLLLRHSRDIWRSTPPPRYTLSRHSINVILLLQLLFDVVVDRFGMVYAPSVAPLVLNRKKARALAQSLGRRTRALLSLNIYTRLVFNHYPCRQRLVATLYLYSISISSVVSDCEQRASCCAKLLPIFVGCM
jgi:hypothetical protein